MWITVFWLQKKKKTEKEGCVKKIAADEVIVVFL